MSGEIFSDGSMLEIFRAEVETHVESLTSGLLALEREPDDTSYIDEMMRGAHSIKGAARIVGIEPAVRVAHVMEDGFVAAQNGKLVLRPEHVDVLLRGVDMLNRIANASKDPAIDWQLLNEQATPLVAEISAVLSGYPKPASIAAQPPEQTRSVQQASAIDRSATVLTSTDQLTILLPAMFDTSAAETARIAFVAGLDSNAKSIRFDLSSTVDLDATGLALLASIPANVGPNGPRIELIGASTDLQFVLRATGIDTLFPTGGM